jgi:hypothetical protein
LVAIEDKALLTITVSAGSALIFSLMKSSRFRRGLDSNQGVMIALSEQVLTLDLNLQAASPHAIRATARQRASAMGLHQLSNGS